MPNTETEIALVKNDLGTMQNLFIKFEATLDKISEISVNVAQMLAVHEERISQGEDDTAKVNDLIERSRVKAEEDSREIHSRMTTSNRELRAEMSKDLDRVISAIEDLKKLINEKDSALEKRITALERWRWVLIGGMTLAAVFAPAALKLM